MLAATERSSKHLTEGLESSGSFWLKKNTVKIPSIHEPAKKHSITSLSSSISDSTDDLEDYINDLKSLGDVSTGEHRNSELKTKPVHKSEKTTPTLRSQQESVSGTVSQSSYSFDVDKDKFHRNILTFEDLADEVVITDKDQDLVSSLHPLSLQSSPSPSPLSDNESTSDEVSETIKKSLFPNIHLVTELQEESINESLEESLDLHQTTDENYYNSEYRSETLSQDRAETLSQDRAETLSQNRAETLSDQATNEEYDYSMDFESDISEEEKSIEQDTSSSPNFPRQPVHLKECSVQTEDVLVKVPFCDYLNSTSLLPHVVKPEQIEAFTAYTPNSLVLQDLVRSQVALAKHLIDQSKRLSDQLATSLEANHHYMTLDDTKEFIESNKPKVLTFKEAMKMVRKDNL